MSTDTFSSTEPQQAKYKRRKLQKDIKHMGPEHASREKISVIFWGLGGDKIENFPMEKKTKLSWPKSAICVMQNLQNVQNFVREG